MPDKSVSVVPSLLALVAAAATFGGVAQIGVTLALGIARSWTQFLGFVMLSVIFSGGSTVLLSEGAHLNSLISATVGALLGTVPALITLRLGLTFAGKRYGIDVAGEVQRMQEKPPPEVKKDA